MGTPLLSELVILFTLAIAVVLFCHRLGVPTIVGFLLTGIVCGPHGLALIKEVSDVQTLAKMGIILLLFTVGMEFSLRKILKYKRYFILGGGLQVVLTTLIGYGVGILLGRPMGESIFLGFLLSLSSTAIVLRELTEKMETDTPHGRLILGTLIFQDIIVVPMMLLTPLLAGAVEGTPDFGFLVAIGKGIAILCIVFIAAERIVPRLLYQIAHTRSRELFILSVLTICSLVAWIAASIGLTVSIGAFLAGLIISESEYSSEAISDILPFQDVFTSLFFVSVGMLLDIDFILAEPVMIIFITAGVLLMKFGVVAVAGSLIGMPLRTAFIAGISLCQVGEFSFVLIKSGMDLQIASVYHYQLFLAVTILTMAVTPLLMRIAPSLSNHILRLPFPQKIVSGLSKEQVTARPKIVNHVIIVGYGPVGKNLARACREANVPYLILEMNAETVRAEKERGEPIHFGDATHEVVLRHANIFSARVVAIGINDSVASYRIVKKVRQMNPDLHIVVRTRYMFEIEPMLDLGANDIIADEFGTSVEIFTRVLHRYRVPFEEIDTIAEHIRHEGQELYGRHSHSPVSLLDFKMDLNDVAIQTFKVENGSLLIGQTPEEAGFGNGLGVSVILIRRERTTHQRIPQGFTFKAEDHLVCVGNHENVKSVRKLFQSEKNEST